MTGPVAPVAGVQRRSRRVWALLLWAPVLIALGLLVLSGESGAVVRALRTAQPGWVVALLAVGLALPVVHARRWQAMLRAVDADVPLLAAVDMTVTASLLNYAVPGYVGSPAKGLLARQLHGVGFGRSVPTLAAEQGLDALALFAGTLVGMILMGPTGVGWVREAVDRSLLGAVIVALVALVVVGAMAVVLGRRYARRFVAAVGESARMLAADRDQRLPILLLTFLYWGLGVAAVWAAVQAVGIGLSPVSLLLMGNAPALLGLLAPIPGGVGLREGAMAAIAGAVGVTVSGIVAAAVLQRAVLVAALPLTLAAVRLARRGRAWR